MNALSPLDYTALIFFLVTVFGYGWLSRHGNLKEQHIASGMHLQREKWIKAMLERETRMLDMLILTNLSQGNAFFASTAIVIVGALATTLGSAQEIATMLAQLPMAANNTPEIIKLKIMFMILVFLIAFFKFAWAFRLTHYTSILIGATPLAPNTNDQASQEHAERTIQLADLAGYHSNGGLHTYYYGIAASGWFLNPYVFIGATTLILAVLYRREFHSRSHAIINHHQKKS